METIPLLRELLVILLLATGVILVCHRLHIPPIVGLLLTGILSGPYGFGFIERMEEVQALSSIGLVMLLFIIGMEISVKKILQAKRFFFLGGALQLLLTLLSGYAISTLMGRPVGEAIFFGCLLSLSSTAVVLRVLGQRQETDTPHGRAIVAILIFQDFCAVPMILALPFLAGQGGALDLLLAWHLAVGVVLVMGVAAAAWWVVPRLLYLVAKTRIRELFLFAVLAICIGVAWSIQQAGLSLSLGAFLAGLIISQSDFHHEAISDIIPLQDLFTSFFFIAIGMLLDLRQFFFSFWLIAPLAFGILLLKTSLTAVAALLCGATLRTSLLIGLALSQVGEFSLVLAKEGDLQMGVPFVYHQLFLALAVSTMAITPTVISFSHQIAYWLASFFRPSCQQMQEDREEEQPLKDHLIIIGFGLAGRTLAHSCREASIPYVIVEMNAKTVRQEHQRGEPIYFGDATRQEIFHRMNIEQAKAVAVAINDPVAVQRIVRLVKKVSSSLYVVVRTRYLSEVQPLYEQGANEVVPDEYGAAIELFTRVVYYFGKPVDQIRELVTEQLLRGYELFGLQYGSGRTTVAPKVVLPHHWNVEVVEVALQDPFCGKSLADSGFWSDPQTTLLALHRGGSTLHGLESTTLLQEQDLLLLIRRG